MQAHTNPTCDMRIVDLLRKDLISELRATNRDDVIQELGTFLAHHHLEVSEEEAVRVLAARERLGSTAVGEGLAIPHGKLRSIRNPVACLGRSRKGIEFGAADGQPTHFFFVLVAPESAPGQHLKALARISRLFKHADFRARLTAAQTAEEVYEIIEAEDVD